MFKDFKAFIMRGNVVDLAVAVIIGGAFGKITSSLVDDVIMPPIGMVLGRINFNDLAVVLGPGADGKPVLLKYGSFINTVLNFLIIALVVFILVKMIEALKHREEAKPAEAATKECPLCTTVIPIKAIRCPQCTADLK